MSFLRRYWSHRRVNHLFLDGESTLICAAVMFLSMPVAGIKVRRGRYFDTRRSKSATVPAVSARSLAVYTAGQSTARDGNRATSMSQHRRGRRENAALRSASCPQGRPNT